MSSTNNGNDDGARADELDLGQENGAFGARTNGHIPDVDEPANRIAVDEQWDDQLIQSDAPVPVATSTDEHNVASSANGPEEDDPFRRPAAAAEDSSSVPDDTPSLHDSLHSFPSSSAIVFRGSPGLSPGPTHRPFDLRFQSRLSSSSLNSPRSPSPFLAPGHSRHSSLASRARSATPEIESDPSQAPWEVVRWTKLRKITGQAFSEAGRRNWGHPTCMTISTVIVLGTSRGIILVFDYQQNLKTIIGPGTKAVECGAVMSLATSADHSVVGAGYASGDIFTWEISRAARPFLHIPPATLQQRAASGSDGHISGVSVIHVGFLGVRRTALVSADDRGMAFSHLATRGMGAVGRTVKTTRLLGRYPEVTPNPARPRKPSSVLAFSPLPLGNVDQPTDGMGLVAMLTPYLLVIVSTTPIAQTQFKSPRPKEVASHGVRTGALAWFPAIKLKGRNDTSLTKLVYCWSNVLTVLDVSEAEPDSDASRDRPPVLEFRPRSRWRAKEAIVAVQWLSRSVLAVLTVTQQLLILEDPSLRVTDSFDLLHKHIYHVDLFSSQLQALVEQYDEEDPSMHGVVGDAFYQSFRAYKGRLFLLGHNDISVGGLSNWADRLLAYIEVGDFVAAIRLANSYYSGDAEKLTIGLPEEDDLRHAMVQEKLLEMISASLKYAFGRNQEAGAERLERSQLADLADASIEACVRMQNYEFLWDQVYNWYEDHESESIFLDTLESHISDGSVRSLPPTALKALINHYSTTHTSSRLEEIICSLDPTAMDIEQVTTLCKQHNLYDAFIYVWNRVLRDYIGPLEELLNLAARAMRSLANGTGTDLENAGYDYNNASKMFPYLSFILTGRVYPTGDDMEDDEASKAKTSLYTYLFGGSGSRGSFAALRAILKFDASAFMSMLNEAFEDSYLNDSPDLANSESAPGSAAKGMVINRQYLVSILLEVMNTPEFRPIETIYLDMFLARNLPKYPQYLLLSGSTLHQVLTRLCRFPSDDMADDCELSVEYLLSMYHPPDIQSLIPLFQEARFYRVLKSTYHAEKQYADWILTYLEDPSERETVFRCLHECLRASSGLNAKQRRDVIQAVKDHAGELARINVSKAARTVHALVPSLHESFLDALEEDEYKQYHYLGTLLEPEIHFPEKHVQPAKLDGWMIERYMRLLCRYNPSHVADFANSLGAGDIQLEEVLPWMEESGVVDAAVILLARQGQVREAMDRLLAHLSTLESGLSGILRNVRDTPDSANTAEAIDDLLQSLEKFSGIGSWLCLEQMRSGPSPRGEVATGGRRSAVALHQPLSFEETLWLDLIDAVVRIARNVSSLVQEASSGQAKTSAWLQPADEEGSSSKLTSAVRRLVQRAFTALLTSTTPAGTGSSLLNRADVSFLRILRAFLSRAARWSPSLSELREVLASIFSAYTYEESLLGLANGMLDRDLFVHVDEVTRLRQRGWRPRGQVCEICRQRVWGPGAGADVWSAWERRQAEEQQQRRANNAPEDQQAQDRGKGKGKGKRASAHARTDTAGSVADVAGNVGAGPVVVFACRHLCHRDCILMKPAAATAGSDRELDPLDKGVFQEGKPRCPVCK